MDLSREHITAWNNFPNLSTADELSIYFSELHNHSFYYHFTSLEKVNKILDQYCFWLSDSSEFNDTRDKEQFAIQDDSSTTPNYKKYYTLCFGTGTNENLPMWYLYSGINGDGGRLQFSQTLIRNAYERGKFTLCEICDGKPPIEIAVLKDGDNATFNFRDVLYYKSDGCKNVSLKYNTMTNYRVSNTEFEIFKKEYRGFLKGLIWYYEKETRIVIELSDELFERIKDDGKTYKVIWDFSDSGRGKGAPKINAQRYLKLDLGPTVEDQDAAIQPYENICRFHRIKSNINLSAYKGTVKFDLCKKCKKCDDCKEKQAAISASQSTEGE